MKTSESTKQVLPWNKHTYGDYKVLFLNKKQTKNKYMQTYCVTKSMQVMLVQCHHRRLNEINCLLLFNEIYDKGGLFGWPRR